MSRFIADPVLFMADPDRDAVLSDFSDFLVMDLVELRCIYFGSVLSTTNPLMVSFGLEILIETAPLNFDLFSDFYSLRVFGISPGPPEGSP